MGKETPLKSKGKKTADSAGTRPVRKKKVSGRTKGKRRPWTQVHCNFFLIGIASGLTVFIGLTLYLFVLLDIPNLKSIRDYEPKMTTLVLARNNQVVKEIFEENRRVVPLDMMPELLPKAFVAAEDARFYEHPGVDVWSIFRALFHNFRAGSKAQGGSTITQQVTRSLLLSRKKVYSRKIKEAILAYRIDTVMSKDEILYIYLNQIYLGEGAYGVEAAARTYFNRTARDLSLAQMALLAGMPQAPSRYSPFKDLELTKKRQAYVLNRMAEEGYITPAAARQAFDAPLGLRTAQDAFSGGGYYIQQVSNYINSRYGQETLAKGGLTVYTCLDPAIQHEADLAVQRGIASFVNSRQDLISPQAAMVVLETSTGRVRAVVGGLDFSTSQFDRAVQARRQPGSSFKPIVYATALERGFRPDSELIDEPLRLKGAGRGQTWEPKNFDNRYHGPTTLQEGLVHSRNIIAIKLLQEVGADRVISMARNLGIQSPIKPDLTLALGSSGISLLEMTGAYSAFANRGSYMPPLFIEKIVDRHGKILEENSPGRRRAMSEKTAVQMDRMLQEVISRGTGRKAQGLKVTAAGKTGTTDNNMDAWFIGYTRDFLAGVWVGYDKNISLGKDVSGGQVAAPIWRDFMKQMEEKN
jgi:penicillin-binding protein 1A